MKPGYLALAPMAAGFFRRSTIIKKAAWAAEAARRDIAPHGDRQNPISRTARRAVADRSGVSIHAPRPPLHPATISRRY
jgi:hypothetical protein